MSRSQAQRAVDGLQAITALRRYRLYLGAEDRAMADMALDASLRQLQILGEVARAMSEETRREHPTVPWRSVIGMCNIVVHEYFEVSAAQVAEVVDDELAVLEKALRSVARGD